MSTIQSECAARIVEVVPLVLRHLRAHVRSQKSLKFTIPQFRVLTYLHLNGEATLSDLAASQGVSLPTMSKLVGSLVQRELIAREGHGGDRRKLRLQLTSAGQRAYESTMENTREFAAAKVAPLSDSEQRLIIEALRLLQTVFEPPKIRFGAG
jgi:DNA-binding MarR family transcriptional regulator